MDIPDYLRDCGEDIPEHDLLEIAQIIYEHQRDTQPTATTELTRLGAWYALSKLAQGEIQLLCRALLAREDIARDLAHEVGIDNFGTVNSDE